MEFGIFLTLQSPTTRPAAEIYQRGIEIVQTAEQLGFGRAWLAEHHFTNYSYSSHPLTLLAHLAAKTKHIRLGVAIIPVPLHHPLLIAEGCATVDLLSQGRFEVGFGKGYQQYQYDRLGIEKTNDHEAFNEAIETINLALLGKSFSYAGVHFKIPETLIYPQPVQAIIPKWLVVNTTIKESIVLALKYNFNIFTGVLEPISKLTNMKTLYPDLFQFPHIPHPNYIGTQRPVFVSYDKANVLRAVEEARWNARVSVGLRHNLEKAHAGVASASAQNQELSAEQILADYMVAGTPEQCIQQIQKLRDGLGINYFSASFWFGDLQQKMVLDSMELFAREVMPALQDKR